jgi:hypothetical protein
MVKALQAIAKYKGKAQRLDDGKYGEKRQKFKS